MNAGKKIAHLLGAGLLAGLGLVGIGAATSAQAAGANVCNDYATDQGGQGMECTVTVANYVNGVDEYSTVTIKECHGAAYTVLLAPACTTTIIINVELTDSVTQCNGTLNGGGSNVTCSVRVDNYFSGTATPALATWNQCVGSGEGGTSPTGTPLNCSPPGLTIGATVTQCNGSVNGGGSPLRVNCDVATGAESALPVTINQCNGTVNGGGSVLFCHAEFGNSYNVDFADLGLPTAPGGTSTTTEVSDTGGTFGTPGGPDFEAPDVGGVTDVPGGATGSGELLALSGSGGSLGAAMAAITTILLGVAVAAFGARRIRRSAHRLG